MSQNFCLECGAPLNDNKFCTRCGAKASEQPKESIQQSVPIQQVAPMQPITNVQPDVKGTKYEPISTWGFIGLTLLMLIPCVNLILMIVWSCGGCKKIQKTYWARASLILMIIGLLLSFAIGYWAKTLISDMIPVSLTGGTEKYERLIEAVENKDKQTLLDMGYSQKDIDEVLSKE